MPWGAWQVPVMVPCGVEKLQLSLALAVLQAASASAGGPSPCLGCAMATDEASTAATAANADHERVVEKMDCVRMMRVFQMKLRGMRERQLRTAMWSNCALESIASP